MSARTLVVDFDGTITEQDLLDTIAQVFGDVEVYKEVDEGLDDHSLTLNEVIRREFEPVRAPLGEVRDWVLENVRVGQVPRRGRARARARLAVRHRLVGLPRADRAGARARA